MKNSSMVFVSSGDTFYISLFFCLKCHKLCVDCRPSLFEMYRGGLINREIWFIRVSREKAQREMQLMQSLFVDVALNNRLGQLVQLQAFQTHHHGRDYIFVVAPNQAANFVSKNAEPFAFQLREHFAVDPRRFELIEVRNPEAETQLIRWRFEWVGHSPISARAEHIISPSQRSTLLGLLGLDDMAAVANG